jgi:hypothetical protein
MDVLRLPVDVFVAFTSNESYDEFSTKALQITFARGSEK